MENTTRRLNIRTLDEEQRVSNYYRPPRIKSEINLVRCLAGLGIQANEQ